MQSTDFMDNPIDRNAVTQPTDPARTELPIDWQQLRQLSDGNEEFESELLHIFVTETASLLRQGQQAILHSQATPLAHIAHQMKGSGGNIGMREIVRLARELEQSAKCEDWESATNQIAQIGRSLTFIQQFLQP